MSASVVLRTGNGLSDLVDAIAADLDTVRTDPFAADLVAIGHSGIQRWTAQRLSLRLGAEQADGVAAGIDFPLLNDFVRRTELTACGLDETEDPWRESALVWPVLAAFDIAMDSPWFASVASHLQPGDDARPGRRYATARRIARLFHRYATWRPALLTDVTDPLNAWQPKLWDLVCGLVEAPVPWQRRLDAVNALRKDPSLIMSPDTIHVLAPRRLTPAAVDILTVLGEHRRVNLWWPTLEPQRPDMLPTRSFPRALGGADRGSLARVVAAGFRLQPVDDTTPVPPPTSMLTAVQQATRGHQVTPVTADASIQLHQSHGPDRQVEVLADVVVDLLESVPGLEPRDIAVLTPDLATYAGLVTAMCTVDPSVARADLHPITTVPIRVSDQSLLQANPVLMLLDQLLSLTTSRGELTALLDLCALAPVARRFGFDSESLDRIRELATAAGIRWGVDMDARKRFDLSHIGQNTWMAGIQRLLLGVAIPSHSLNSVRNVLPAERIESTDTEVIGALAELFSVVRRARTLFSTPATPGEWAQRFTEVLEPLVLLSDNDSWQMAHAARLFSDFADRDQERQLAIGDVRRVVGAWLLSRSPRSALGTGALTVTSLSTLRSVPHRVVIVIGVDEASFPRRGNDDGDDMLARTPTDDEPSAARDDRQEFLDAVMSATDVFAVIFAGRDQRTNELLPTPSPVVELADAVNEVCPAPDTLWRQHPLQPFAPVTTPTYDPAVASARRVLAERRRVTVPHQRRFDTDALPAPDRLTRVTTGDLAGFLRHPPRTLLRTRIGSWWGISSGSDQPKDEDPVPTEIPVEGGPLHAWAVANRLLTEVVAGHAPDTAVAAERLRGELAPLQLGQVQLSQAEQQAAAAYRAAEPYLQMDAAFHHLEATLPSGRVITADLETRDGALVSVTASKAANKQLISGWVELLAAVAADPEREWKAVVAGRTGVTFLRAPDPEQSLQLLDELLDLMQAGVSRPMPLPPDFGMRLAGVGQRVVTDDELGRWWDWEPKKDATWRTFFSRLTDLQEDAATHWGGLDTLAHQCYDALLAHEVRA